MSSSLETLIGEFADQLDRCSLSSEPEPLRLQCNVETSRGPPTFLSLPSSIRTRIYGFAGLTRPCPIDFQYEKSTRELRLGHCHLKGGASVRCKTAECEEWRSVKDSWENVGDCLCPPLPSSLLYVCRRVHTEAEHHLYSSNTVKVVQLSPRSFRPLSRLSDAALGAIRKLHIRLNTWPCPHHSSQEAPISRGCGYCRSIGPFSGRTRKEKTILEQWQGVCDRLSKVQKHGQLSFSFVCDCVDAEAAAPIVATLRSLPRMAQAAVRLGRSPNLIELKKLARETALWMTGRVEPPSPTFHRFLDLPRELQLNVIRQTDFNWHSDVTVDERLHICHPSAYSCCSRCNIGRGPCCCPTRCAGSPISCDCKHFPIALLVSRQMRLDALQLLFKSTRITTWMPPGYVLRFLDGLPPSTLPYLRHLRVEILADDAVSWFRGGFDKEWAAVIEYVRTNLSLGRLRLDVKLKFFDSWDFLTSATVGGPRQHFDVYSTVLVELLRLNGLHVLQVELEAFRDLEIVTERALLGPAAVCPDEKLRIEREVREHNLEWEALAELMLRFTKAKTLLDDLQ